MTVKVVVTRLAAGQLSPHVCPLSAPPSLAPTSLSLLPSQSHTDLLSLALSPSLSFSHATLPRIVLSVVVGRQCVS